MAIKSWMDRSSGLLLQVHLHTLQVRVVVVVSSSIVTYYTYRSRVSTTGSATSSTGAISAPSGTRVWGTEGAAHPRP